MIQYKTSQQVLEEDEEFKKLWDIRDTLARYSEEYIDGTWFKPLSGGIPLRVFAPTINKYRVGTYNYQCQVNQALMLLYQHKQMCCMECNEPCPTYVEKWDEEETTLLSCIPDQKFSCGDMMGMMHSDHKSYPPGEDKITPTKLMEYKKDVATRQLLCTELNCAMYVYLFIYYYNYDISLM